MNMFYNKRKNSKNYSYSLTSVLTFLVLLQFPPWPVPLPLPLWPLPHPPSSFHEHYLIHKKSNAKSHTGLFNIHVHVAPPYEYIYNMQVCYFHAYRKYRLTWTHCAIRQAHGAGIRTTALACAHALGASGGSDIRTYIYRYIHRRIDWK